MEGEGKKDLTLAQVKLIAQAVQHTDAIIVGGQAVNLWCEFFKPRNEWIGSHGPYTSKDIDFYANPVAAQTLAGWLKGEIHKPDPGDATPSAMMVAGHLDGSKIEVDFMTSILGVKPESIRNNFLVVTGETSRGEPLRLCLMHPLDCLRSRLANINTLHRHEATSVNQARAAMEVVRSFVSAALESGETREAITALRNLEHITVEHCIGKDAHARHGIDPTQVLRDFLDDERLNKTWREKSLAPAIRRLEEKWTSRDKARIPPYPQDTHILRVSKDGKTAVVRKKADGDRLGDVDNPCGPAIVTPTKETYFVDGQKMADREAWETVLGTPADNRKTCEK